jgi:hypothetical protein
MFNDIYITREDTVHNTNHTVKVPIGYGPKEKVLARVAADPTLTRQPAIVLPRMSFEITNVQYDGSRKLNTIGKRARPVANTFLNTTTANSNKYQYQYNPVPYDFTVSLSIMVKNTDDGTRIVEQILPFFTPMWTATVELVPDMDLTMDIPIVLSSVNLSDSYEGDFETRRLIVWDLTFVIKGYLFGPIRKSSLIKFANTSVYNSLVANTPLSSVVVIPGLLANGSPTSNASLTIDRSQIFPDDDFGYIVSINE